MEKDMPIYVRIEEYRDVLDVVNMIKHKLADIRGTVEKIQELKNEEDAELDRWETALEGVERKVDFIDKSLFEPESL